ncbi:MAG: T9SS C-terminal target domain-containing protein [Flavobacteriia bacterium]|jgi:hypothetical protein|nr:T9SS C-terminal target domain-containing protein [Flavobacteriia bacterium]NBV69068.1 T9SS C-terminal target domain-containing protein [Flavobacteriia bacterium]NBV91369.1 T9SS C-terminal target domain-containing protein [Flavobacteriia bacterium]NBY41454.1 T9SS C-terminal target domain-containing protein [Flavobacteriia bacterium]
MKSFTLVLLLAVSFSGFTQTNMPDRVVYASAGMYTTPTLGLNLINNKTMTYTIGEPVIYGGLVASKYIFNGFEQGDVLVAVSPGVVMLEKPGQPFKVYPNPATTQSIVAGPEEQTEAVNIQLMDLNGKLIAEYQMENNRLVIDFENQLAPGTYFLNFYNLSGVFIQQTKLMKSNGASN